MWNPPTVHAAPSRARSWLRLLLLSACAASAATDATAQQTTLVAAVLPASRSVQVGTTATAFATVINTGTSTAVGCGIAPATSIPATFSYQTTDPGTNALTGSPNTPVSIGPGAAQSFLVAFTPTATFGSTDAKLNFSCSNASPAASISGLNTLLLSAAATPVPDIIALGATTTNDGIANISGSQGTGVFAVATSNVGASGQITVLADSGPVVLPINLSICQTNPTTAACLAPPSSSVVTTVGSGTTPTFAVFMTATGGTSFDPANNRVSLRFRDATGVTRGATSVAVRTGTQTGSKIYFGYYAEDPTNNPEDPTNGSFIVGLPSSDGLFSGQMPFSYLGCTSSRSVGQVSGSRSGNGVGGNWAGTVDGTAAGGTFTGSYDTAADTISGAYTNSGGKVYISSGTCHYYVAALGTWKAFGSFTSQPKTFVALATTGATPVISWPSLGSGVVYSIRVFDEACLSGNPSIAACFLGEALTPGLSAQYPVNFPGGTALVLGKSYLVLVTGETTSGLFSGFSSFRLQP